MGVCTTNKYDDSPVQRVTPHARASLKPSLSWELNDVFPVIVRQ